MAIEMIEPGTRVRSTEDWGTDEEVTGTFVGFGVPLEDTELAEGFPWPYRIQWDHNPEPVIERGWPHAREEFEIISDEDGDTNE